MARKEITTPLDLKNLDNHNYNYDELYGLVDETDRRISEDMWEETKDANTMKMLEPVQTAADLPSEVADKSLITVIDEQRVYGFVNGEWQPFNQIDLDPFEPFKDELSEIVAAYEKQIQNITQEVQSTKDSAIESIESTQSQSESNINQTEQSAVNSINKAQQEAESQISGSTEALKGKTSELTALFNDSMDKLANKQDTALAEVDSAKQAAIAALEDFQNVDTSNWQKYKLTEDNGVRISKEGLDLLNLETGYYETWNAINRPLDNDTGIFEVNITTGSRGQKTIVATQSHLNRTFINTIHTDGEDRGWKEITTTQTDTGWQPITIKNDYVKSDVPDFDPSYRVIGHDTFKEVFIRFGFEKLTQSKNIVGQMPSNLVPYKIYRNGTTTISKIPPKIIINTSGEIEVHQNTNDEYLDTDYVIYQGSWIIDK